MKPDTEKMITQAAGRMCSAYVAYLTWKRLEQMRNTEEVGKDKAGKNVAIMKPYGNFFGAVHRGMFVTFVIDLCLFFDRHEQSLSLNKIMSELTLSNEDHNKINALLAAHEKNIAYLKDIRDKTVAHVDLDFDPSKVSKIIFKETEDLFRAVQEVFNLLAITFNHSTWIWDHLDGQMEHEIEWLFENLDRGEKKRLKDIEDEYADLKAV